MDNIPCKNCLIFPLCKAQVNEYIEKKKVNGVHNRNNYELRIYGAYCYILEPKCSILYDWLHYTLRETSYKKQITSADYANHVVDNIENTFI